jgi:hypothetical protein
MKKIIFTLLAMSILIATPCLAEQPFTLTTPTTIENQAYGGVITGYEWVPGSNPRFVINFGWTDNNGDQVGSHQKITWTGADYDSIFGFVIRSQDVGIGMGAGLETLIHLRIENKYGVSID